MPSEWGAPQWGPPEQGGRWEDHGDQPPGPAPRRRTALPLVLVVVALLAVVVAVLGFVAPGFFVTKVLDTAAVQAGVARVLSQDYGLADVGPVSCPDGVAVVPGAGFTCRATIAGEEVPVPVRITDGDGGYEVGRPG
jgi:hypothetical protein